MGSHIFHVDSTYTDKKEEHQETTYFKLKMVKKVTPDLWTEQVKVSEVDWEWVIIQIKSVNNLTDDFKTHGADLYITVKAHGTVPTMQFHKRQCNECEFPVKRKQRSPEWNRLGMVAYVKGTADKISFTINNKNRIMRDKKLLSKDVPIPSSSEWDEVSIKDGKVEMVVQMKKGDTPINTPEDQKAMGLKEKVFHLKSGEKASLVYKQVEGNKKAVFYFAGLGDSFAHPNVLQVFLSRGYDFYSLDPHGCGRCSKYLDNPMYVNNVASFDTYEEDIDTALAFAGAEKYDSVLAYCHSTGALIFSNYQMLKSRKTVFTGCIFNGPFLDWGHVTGGVEFLLEHTSILGFFGSDWKMRKSGGLCRWRFMSWLLYRWNLEDRPIIYPHVTGKFAAAATDVQNKLMKLEDPLMGDKPGLLMSSLGDCVVEHEEILDRFQHITSNPEIAEFKHNAHDVLVAYTAELNNDAISALSKWLDTKVL